MNTYYNNQGDVNHQTVQNSSSREWSDYSNYELAECLYTERGILKELVENFKESYFYHLDNIYLGERYLSEYKEFGLDFHDFTEIERIEELDIEVLKSKLNKLKDLNHDLNDMNSIEGLFKEIEEIELSIRTIEMFIRYLKK